MNKGLLLGAGFSYDFGMPLSQELTDIFLGIFNKHNVIKFSEIISQSNPYTKDRPINREAINEGINLLLKYKKMKGKNYEEFLSNLEDLGDQPKKTQSDKDSYHYLFGIFYDIIHKIITAYQNVSYDILYDINFVWFSNLRNLLSEEETWIFTLNHDLYLECLAIDLGIPITYGDLNKISFPISSIDMDNLIHFTCSDRHSVDKNSNGFFCKTKGINLVKLHGGLSELEYKDGKLICNQSLLKKKSSELIEDFIKINDMAYYNQGVRIPSGKDRVITNLSGELDIICKSMLTGGKKYSKTTKFKEGEEKLKLFDDVIKELDELTIIGYGFGDLHVNNRILNAMVLNNNLKLRIVDPINKPIPEFLQQFNYDLRIRGATCGAPQWIDYLDSEKWNTSQTEALKLNEKLRFKIKENVKLILGK